MYIYTFKGFSLRTETKKVNLLGQLTSCNYRDYKLRQAASEILLDFSRFLMNFLLSFESKYSWRLVGS
jgi:hypothetical protein